MTGNAEPYRAETSRAWADIDLGALVANTRAFASLVKTPLLPVVKANAYGLGAAAVVRALEPLGPWGYGVGTVEEGEQIRALGVSRPILVLTPMLPAWGPRHLASGLRPTVGDLDALAAWLALGDAPFHLEIDTGMRRSGIPWNDADAVAQLAGMVTGATGWEGAYCHFHSAESDPAATRLQWARLQETLLALARRPPYVHAANSGAGVMDPGLGGDLARPGIYLYGGRVGRYTPVPVVSFRARVVATRRVPAEETVSYGATWRAAHPTTIVTLAAGYADGVPIALSNRGRVEIRWGQRGQRGEGQEGQQEQEHTCPIAGRVTMDMTMVDVGNLPVQPGDVATFWGGVVTLDQQAEAAGTVAYELLIRLGPRVVRRYRSD